MNFGVSHPPAHNWGDHTADLIFDLGMHNGTDTAYYLHRGFRVVGVEAHPGLCEVTGRRFVAEMDSGRLVIENVAISEKPEVAFFVNEADQWGTICPDWVTRNEELGKGVVDTIIVSGIDVVDLIRKYGIPHYIKIDIEGADLLVLQSLENTNVRPNYLSIEATMTSFADLVNEIDLFERMGYDSFKSVAQHTIGRPGTNRDDGAGYRFPSCASSGPFGDRIPGPWRDRHEILRYYRQIFWRYHLLDDSRHAKTLPRRVLASMLARGLGGAGWWDTHARHRSIAH